MFAVGLDLHKYKYKRAFFSVYSSSLSLWGAGGCGLGCAVPLVGPGAPSSCLKEDEDIILSGLRESCILVILHAPEVL